MLINNISNMDYNEINIGGGDIYYQKNPYITIKLGEFSFREKYGEAVIDLGNVCRIQYAYYVDKEMIGDTPYKYWFKSQYVCDRFHGCYCSDDNWVIDLFKEVSPYNEEINELIVGLIKKICAKATAWNATSNKEAV